MEMDAGLQAFVEESRELLEKAEDTLLHLEDNPHDADLVNELFRVVHTIKGAAGLFGFDAVVEFTHLAESVMGRVRENELHIDDDLISLFLKSRDHISALVAQAIEDDSGDPPKEGEVLQKSLSKYLSTDHGEDSATRQATVPQVDVEQSQPENVEEQVQTPHWHISLRFGKDVLRSGMDPLSFIRYLGGIGEIDKLSTVYGELPELDKFDSEECFLGFELGFKSEATKEEIENVFEFVQDDCALTILPPHCAVWEYQQLVEQLPEDNERLVDLLKKDERLTPDEARLILEEKRPELAADRVEQNQGEAEVSETANGGKAAIRAAAKVTETKATDQQVIRVNAGKLEELINLVGELVISGANTKTMADRSGDARMVEAIGDMSRLVESIRDTALSLRMVQIGETFNRFRRVVREVSREVGKEIEFLIEGGDTELDKTVVEKIGDPLMHLIRNAIDHGIETPEVRAKSNKPVKGTIRISAHHDSGSIVIEVEDDGGGLKRDKILAKALERGLIKPNHTLSDREIYALIFEPGFSTTDKVTNLSGRGVGMDVVKRNIDNLRGQAEVDSVPNEGSKFSIRLPLTLAIIDGFQVRVGDASYVIPLDLVVECIELEREFQQESANSNYVNLRGEVLPFVRLGELFNISPGEHELENSRHRNNIVVVQFAGQKTGLVVDELLGEYQTVIKPLGPIFQYLRGISGATILGSGEVAMIIDVPALINYIVTQNNYAGRTVVEKSPRKH